MDTTTPGKIGKYEIIKVLGRGGMGEVLLAQDRDLGRRVAIKRPFKSAMEDGFARFQVEARAATLRHPNIPAVYEMGEQDGLPYIAMEFVEGESLDKIIASGKPLDLIEKLSIIEQVCSALGHAHEKGIIHRDIKPANVILQADGVAKIIDFGIAKILSPDAKTGLTQTSQIIGSLHYIAPERFKGETVDGRSDIFSAGVMLYLLLTGHLPFAGGEETASYKIVNEEHTSLGTYLHDYPPALDGILEQAMAKNPNLRYSTAEDFADALHDVIVGLRQARVGQLIEDAERLTMESRYSPALDLLQEATKLDPDNTQVKKMRRFVREHLERSKRAERVRELIRTADEALVTEKFSDAITSLKEAQSLDPTATTLIQRIQVAEEKKRLYEKSSAALSAASAARDRGDITGSLRFVDKALQEDPENLKLLAARAALVKEAEAQAQQGKLLQILETARGEVAERHLDAVEALLREAETIDASHPDIDKIRQEVARVKEQEERRQLLDEIRRRVSEFLRTDNFEQASDLLNRAIEKLPTESMLHRLKAEVDAGANRFHSKRFVDDSIAKARDLFATSPQEALALLQNAIEQVPGEERLIAYSQTLRKRFDALRADQQLADTLRNARALLAEKQYDKAIGVLESFTLEFGSQPDIDDLITFAKDEQTAGRRRSVVERCVTESRTLIQAERLEDAIRLLEAGIRETSDVSLSRLLDEVRGQQVAIVRKLEVLQKRVALLRERGELDEGIQLLQEYLATTPKSAQVQDLLKSLTAERKQRQVTNETLRTARALLAEQQYDKALGVLESYRLEFGNQPDVDDLLASAKDQLAALRRHSVVERCVDEARPLIQAERLDDAIRVLEAGIRETGDASLSRILDEVRSQQVAIARKLEVLQKRVALLRERGELDEAIQHLQEYLAATPRSAQAHELLTALTAERQQKQITNQAIATARQASQQKNFAAGLESLHAVMRAYGESPELTREVESIEAARRAYAQEVVDKSIESARAALLKNDAQSALTALKSESDWIGYTDAKRQADWQRILQSVKKAIPDASVSVPANAMLVAEPHKFPVWMMAAVGVVLVAVVGFVVWKETRPAPLPSVAEARLVIAKAPPNASVVIDSTPAVQTDGNGDLSIVVKPGPHHLIVSKDGFLPFTDDVTVGTGEIYRDPALLSPMPAAEKSGTLTVQGNIPEFRVFVDGQSKGMIHQGTPIPLEAGNHKVRYSAPGYADSPEKPILVSVKKDTPDIFKLDKLAPPTATTGNLVIETNAGAHILIDGGQHQGVADSNGKYPVQGLSPGQHMIAVSLDGFQSIPSRPVNIAAGQTQTSNAQLAALTPTLAFFKADPPTAVETGQPVILSWQVNNASSVSIDGIGSVPNSGARTVTPDQSTTYKLIANGTVALQTVTVNVHAKPTESIQHLGDNNPQSKPTLGPAMPDKSVLVSALAGYKDVYKRASGGDKKACQAAFKGAFKGKLQDLADWCELSKGFDVAEACPDQPTGSPEAPSLSCTETTRIFLKDGDPKSAQRHKTFHFIKTGDSWQVTTWE